MGMTEVGRGGGGWGGEAEAEAENWEDLLLAGRAAMSASERARGRRRQHGGVAKSGRVRGHVRGMPLSVGGTRVGCHVPRWSRARDHYSES